MSCYKKSFADSKETDHPNAIGGNGLCKELLKICIA